jgi:multiphosphoryl transfer protein
MSDKITATLTFHHPGGLHARPSAKLAMMMKHMNADVFVIKNGERANLKDILHVLSLGIHPGHVTLEATGPDAEKALGKIEEIFLADFKEYE